MREAESSMQRGGSCKQEAYGKLKEDGLFDAGF
jgi:hypothetical protein